MCFSLDSSCRIHHALLSHKYSPCLKHTASCGSQLEENIYLPCNGGQAQEMLDVTLDDLSPEAEFRSNELQVRFNYEVVNNAQYSDCWFCPVNLLSHSVCLFYNLTDLSPSRSLTGSRHYRGPASVRNHVIFSV